MSPNNRLCEIITRQELYDLVWAKPMVQLGQQFQLSDNGLRKICRKYAIPVPKMGYWQKLRYDKPTKKIPLPTYPEENPAIKILANQRDKLNPVVILKESVKVPEQITKFHPLVAQTKKLFSQGHARHGRISLGEKALDVYVSKAQASRAFRIMDTIIKELEQHAITVCVEHHNYWGQSTYAFVDGEKVYFCIEEPLRIVKTESGQYGYKTQDFEPTGTLALRIKDQLGGARNNWKDGDNHKVEDKLDSFINGLGVAAAYLKKKRLEDEERHRKWEEAEQAEARKRQAVEDERKRGQILEQQVESWHKSRAIRELIQAAVAKRGAYAPDSKFAEWVTWATAYANKFDPLRELKPPSQ